MIIAGIDVGTNTLRLLVAEVGAGSFRQLLSNRIITRLGEGLERSGVLSHAAQERSFAALAVFAEQLRRYPSAVIDAVGTSALRNANNAAAFIRTAEERLGVTIRIIEGDEEARLTLLGVERALGATGGAGLPEPAMVIDIGGGSTEVILSRGGGSREEASLPLGAVYLTERFISHDPPQPEEIDAVRTAVTGELGKHGALFGDGLRALIGTAGTITTLAAMDQELSAYDPERINNYVLSKAALDRLIDKLSSSTLAERRGFRGLERGREDIILAGAVVTQEIFGRTSLPEMRVSDWGLREGIVLNRYEN